MSAAAFLFVALITKSERARGNFVKIAAYRLPARVPSHGLDTPARGR